MSSAKDMGIDPGDIVEFEDGKYEIVRSAVTGSLEYTVFRYGEVWAPVQNDLVGNKFMYHMIDALFEAQDERRLRESDKVEEKSEGRAVDPRRDLFIEEALRVYDSGRSMYQSNLSLEEVRIMGDVISGVREDPTDALTLRQARDIVRRIDVDLVAHDEIKEQLVIFKERLHRR